MHSSRMLTTRLLPVSPSMHCAEGICFPGGVYFQGGVCSRGVFACGGGVCFLGGSAPWGCISACTEADTPL